MTTTTLAGALSPVQPPRPPVIADPGRPAFDTLRWRAEMIATRLAMAVMAARPLLADDFSLRTEITLAPDEGGATLSFHCTRERLLCFRGRRRILALPLDRPRAFS